MERSSPMLYVGMGLDIIGLGSLRALSLQIKNLRQVRYFPVQAPGMSQNLMEGVALVHRIS